MSRPGFDPDSGIFYDGPPISRTEGIAALAAALCGGACWEEEVDRVNANGAMLTTLTMPMWKRGHPFVAINDNSAGVGKSTLARVIALVAECPGGAGRAGGCERSELARRLMSDHTYDMILIDPH